MGIFTDFATSSGGALLQGVLDEADNIARQDAQTNAIVAQNALDKENEAFKKTELAFKHKDELIKTIVANAEEFGIVAGELTVDQIADRLVSKVFNNQRSIFEQKDYKLVSRDVAKYLARDMGKEIEINNPYIPAQDLFNQEAEKHSARISAITKMPKADKLLHNIQKAEAKVESPEVMFSKAMTIAPLSAKAYGILGYYPDTKEGRDALAFQKTSLIVANARFYHPDDPKARAEFMERKLFENQIDPFAALQFKNPMNFRQITSVLDQMSANTSTQMLMLTNKMNNPELTEEGRLEIKGQIDQLVLEQMRQVNNASSIAIMTMARQNVPVDQSMINTEAPIVDEGATGAQIEQEKAKLKPKLRFGNKKKIIILGGGPNRIGQGIEFDYCCCQASFSLKEAGFETIMINCNPETVSTDYDTSDRLYFEPLIEEYVENIILKEKSKGNLIGVIAQFGGQTPIKLAKFLDENKLPILGTQYKSIDLAEDRDRFRELLIKLKLKQAESGIAYKFDQAINVAEKIGLPVVVRPSYVLGGRAMEIVHDKSQLKQFINEAFKASEQNPILIDKFIDNAMEVDVDAISDGKDVYVAGIMQHIEEAGIHSGDSACCLPPVSIKANLLRELKIQTRKLALALKVKGFLNIQFAIKNDEIFVIEVNPRASRTVPFVSKANGIPLAKIASRIMSGEKLSKYKLKYKTNKKFAVKEAVFPFNKFPDSDLLLGPEMKSTGEVMGFDDDFGMAVAKSQIAASNSLPTKGMAFLSVKDSHKQEIIGVAQRLIKLGFTLSATKGTSEILKQNGMKCKKINKVSSGRPHIVDVLNSKKISLVINTGGGNSEHRISDARALRRGTLANKIPYCTNMSTAYSFLEAIKSLKTTKLRVKSLQDN